MLDVHAFRTLLTLDGYERVRVKCMALLGSPKCQRRIAASWELTEGWKATAQAPENWWTRDWERLSEAAKLYVDPATASIAHGCVECVEFLLETRAVRPTMFNKDGESFLGRAVVADTKEVQDLLLAALDAGQLIWPLLARRPRDSGWTYLTAVARDPARFRNVWCKLESNPELDLTAQLDPGGLYHVCKHATVDLAVRLCQRGLNLGNATRNGRGCWHVVAESNLNSVEMSQWLLRHATDPPHTATGNGETALMTAIRGGRSEVGGWLARHSNTKVKNAVGHTAAELAAEHKSDSSVIILEEILRHTPLTDPSDLELGKRIIRNIVTGIWAEKDGLSGVTQCWPRKTAAEPIRRQIQVDEDGVLEARAMAKLAIVVDGATVTS
ncbi:hypothetical protein NUU61_001320 [Penicillium alfredii]|uniref:Uncharacterized protein n=1 Tax=Penicillium alfredii TaxID=1506179 RepID=A0A9W9KMI8_9EURO|nr:uncharacterized protein NUU61_001320 [Penicillium alfredii]KAJ5111690.1 hypothetical protein NUU61_001320 [Penicillium alfredii]